MSSKSTLVVVLAQLVIALTSIPASGRAPEASIEQTLRGLSDQWAKAGVTRDAAVLRQIWAADFVYVEASGRVINKDEGIADIAKVTDKYTSVEVSNFKVRVYGAGTVAVAIGDERDIGRDKDGKAFDRKIRFTNVWVLQNGSWQCVSGHSSNLPAE